MAIGVFSFCLLTLIALIPVGLTDNKSSRDRMIVADLCSSLESDLRSTAPTGTLSPINAIKFPAPSAGSYVSITNTLYDTYLGALAHGDLQHHARARQPVLLHRRPHLRAHAELSEQPGRRRHPGDVAAAADPAASAGTVRASVAINRF
ncbi:MAG: hypothetical protein WDO13_19150 [Verrucomicrobiota bacterium]